MNKLIITFLFSAFFNAGHPQNTESAGYAFIKKEKGIALYYRWITMPDKLKVRELKAVFDIHASPEKIISVLKDERVATQWMKGTCEVNRVGSMSDHQWQTYIQYDIPWPLSNQDCIVRYDLKRDGSNNSYCISMNGLPRLMPVKEGITRIQHMEGTWRLTPLNSNVSKVEYTVYSAQAPKFPRWVTDPIVQGNLISTMEAFRLTVEKSKKI